MSDARREEFARRFRAGEPYSTMSAVLGIAVGTLEGWRIMMGLPKRTGRTAANLYGRPVEARHQLKPRKFVSDELDDFRSVVVAPCVVCGRTRAIAGACIRCGTRRNET